MSYDPRHQPPGWTEQDDLEEPVWIGLHETGDLGPLIEFLRSGHPLGALAGELAAMIEAGQFGFTAGDIDPKKGRKPMPRSLMMEVGAFVYVRDRRSPHGWQQRHFDEAVAHFDDKRVTVRSARSALRRFREAWRDPVNIIDLAPIWGRALRDYCDAIGADYDIEVSRYHFDRN